MIQDWLSLCFIHWKMVNSTKSYLKAIVKNYTAKDVTIFDKDAEALIKFIKESLPKPELRSCRIVTKSDKYELDLSDYVMDGDFYVFSSDKPLLQVHKNHIITIEWNYQDQN